MQEVDMGQRSSQPIVNVTEDGDQEAVIRSTTRELKTFEDAIEADERQGNVDGDLHTRIEKVRKRKKTKKRKRGRDVDPDQHSKEEESARTLLEMKGTQDLARVPSNEDDFAASSQVLAESQTQDRSDVAEDPFYDPPQEEERRPKSQKSRKSGRWRMDCYAEQDQDITITNAESAGTKEPSKRLIDGSHMYPDPQFQQYQYESGAVIDNSSNAYGQSQGHAPVATMAEPIEYQNSTSHVPTPPYANSSSSNVYTNHQSPIQQHGLSLNNGVEKRKRKKHHSHPAHNAAELADAATAANALIDPALTGQGTDIWALPHAEPHAALNAVNGNAAITAPGRGSGETPKTKRKRRLPDNDNEAAELQERARKSDGPKVSAPNTKAKMTSPSAKKSGHGGPFDDAEITQLTDFMDRYREEHDISQFDLNEKIQVTGRGTGPKDEFWNEVSAVLPYRTRQSVYKVCRRRFHNYGKRGKWTPEEDDLLKRAQMEKPNRWKDIGAMIGRMPEDARDRWRNYLKCGDNRQHDVWNQEEEDKLEKAVHECIESMKEAREVDRRNAFEMGLSRSVKEDDDDDMSLINWTIVSDKMGGVRSRLQCLYKWKKLKKKEEDEQAVEEENERREAEGLPLKHEAQAKAKPTWRTKRAEQNYAKMLPGDKFDLLKALADSGTYEEKNIPWKIIGTPHFRSIWSTTDRKIAFRHMKELVPHDCSTIFQVIVTTLLTHFYNEYSAYERERRYKPPPPNEEFDKRGRRRNLSSRKIVDEDDGVGDESMQEFASGGAYAPDMEGVVDPGLTAQSGYEQQYLGGGGVDEEMARQMQLLREA
ncbi:MAG: RNA polymerase I enhancer binding protein [Pycnora praestabilis]|nr:MAG: RNA polymerase I enhancer binding protein [Pycnora praestabilis]